MAEVFEQSYYENPELWSPQQTTALEIERVTRIVDWVPEDVRTILDLGCGNGILTNRLTGRWQAMGADRSRAALRWVHAPRCQIDIANVPVRDEAFDCVVCSEVIEHLPVESYKAALGEIARIARRYVLLGVPYCEDLRLNTVTCPQCGHRFHASYHLRRFDRPILDGLLRGQRPFSLLRAEGICETRPYWLLSLLLTLREQRNRIRGISSFPPNGQCPQCGYTRPQSAAVHPSGQRGLSKGRELAARLWPKKSTFRWWLALYQRDEADERGKLNEDPRASAR